MRVFLLDLWLDLREKRLAPLAILLLAGIIAVPIVLAKGQKQVEAPAQPTTTTPAAASAPVIQSQVQEGTVSSKLQTFSARDPFEPTSKVVASTGTGSTSGGGTSTGSGTSTGNGTGSTPSGGAPTGNGPSTTPGTGTPGNPGTPGGTGNTTGETKTTLFTYTTDLRFGQGGDVNAFKGVKRLDLIPTPDDPKIVFLGVTTTGKTAVFLVDQNIGVDTEGRCRPSPDQCNFLYLRPDPDRDQALLTDADGTVYHLRLLAIHRVSISSANGKTNSGSQYSGGGNTNSNRSPAFTGRANSSDSATDPGAGDTPPGEPAKKSSFQQFFADGGGN